MVEWIISERPVGYFEAVKAMEDRVARIISNQAEEAVWFLEHPPLYTAGTSSRESDLLDKTRFPVFQTGRGGQYTYHGPGQRIVYVMLDLNRRGRDLRVYIQNLEAWIIGALAEFGLHGFTDPARVGVWVRRGEETFSGEDGMREDKIAALGIRLRKWVSFHGFSVNISPNLSHFQGIVPCGISDHGVTSFADLGVAANFDSVDLALGAHFAHVFGDQLRGPKNCRGSGKDLLIKN